MDTFIAVAFDMVSLISVLAIIVAGLGITASMMGIFNFAHGEMVLLGALTVYLLGQAHISPWVGILFAPVVVGLIGLVTERVVIRRFYASPIAAMVGTYALGLAIREAVRKYTGGMFIVVPSPLPGAFSMGQLSFSLWRATVILITAAVLFASYLLLRKTNYGLHARAALENPALARASGISTSRLYAGTFSFGCALAGLAGALMVPIYSLHADLGVSFLILSFLGVMLGGVGSFEGPIAGSALIGAGSALLPWLFNPVFANVLVFLIAIAIVKFRPGGLISAR